MALKEHTVTGTIGQFTQGQVLQDRKAIAAYFRAILNEDESVRPSRATDEQILTIVDRYEDITDMEEREMAVLEALEG